MLILLPDVIVVVEPVTSNDPIVVPLTLYCVEAVVEVSVPSSELPMRVIGVPPLLICDVDPLITAELIVNDPAPPLTRIIPAHDIDGICMIVDPIANVVVIPVFGPILVLVLILTPKSIYVHMDMYLEVCLI